MVRYTSLAALYDGLTEECDYHRWVSCVETLYTRLNPGSLLHARVLDLGCGTGRATEELLARGCTVIGVDASNEMLAMAAQRLESYESMPLLLCQDMRQLDLGDAQFDLIIALCDTFSYLTSTQELTATLARVKSSLAPGGVLVFDLNTAWKLSTIYGDHTFIEEGDGYLIAWDNEWQPNKRICKMQLDVFTPSSRYPDLWNRTTEEHIQRAHSPQEVVDALKQSGFNLIIGPLAAFDLNDPSAQTERVFYAAQTSSC